MSQHPQRHLWPALQRRFGDQNKPSTSPDRLLRGLCVRPLDGQEDSSAWTLGFREVGATMRTASLARDFQQLAAMAEPDTPCYFVVYVGDVGAAPLAVPSATGNWALFSYVPSTCSSFEARKMADNRAGLKAGLGGEHFSEGGLWCVSPEQLSLSNYMRSVESGAGGGPSGDAQTPGGGGGGSADKRREIAASKIGAIARGRHSRRSVLPAGGATAGLGLPGALGEELPSDATEAIWEERIKGVRHAYKDSCQRLVGALQELEMSLCQLTGDEFRPDEPLLRARVHMSKNLELLR